MKKITCSYGNHCFVSGIEVNQEPVVLLDFDIKSYKLLNPENGKGWSEHSLPPNAMIHDKLYLTRQTVERVLLILQDFLDTTYIHASEAKETARGFKLVELKDLYGNTVSMQESSNVDPAIWFGCLSHNQVITWQNNQLCEFEFPKGDVLINDRQHLKTREARKMKKAIADEWALALVHFEKKQIEKKIPLIEDSVKSKKKMGI